MTSYEDSLRTLADIVDSEQHRRRVQRERSGSSLTRSHGGQSPSQQGQGSATELRSGGGASGSSHEADVLSRSHEDRTILGAKGARSSGAGGLSVTGTSAGSRSNERSASAGVRQVAPETPTFVRQVGFDAAPASSAASVSDPPTRKVTLSAALSSSGSEGVPKKETPSPSPSPAVAIPAKKDAGKKTPADGEGLVSPRSIVSPRSGTEAANELRQVRSSLEGWSSGSADTGTASKGSPKGLQAQPKEKQQKQTPKQTQKPADAKAPAAKQVSDARPPKQPKHPKQQAQQQQQPKQSKNAGAAAAAPPAGTVSKGAQKQAAAAVSATAAAPHHVLGMFSHLAEPISPYNVPDSLPVQASLLHPAILELGSKYSRGVISGSNARAVALLVALREVIRDFDTPEGVFLFKDLDLRASISHIVRCRPLSIPMGVIIKRVKHFIAMSKSQTTQAEAKAWVLNKIDKFFAERVEFADKEIANIGANKIVDGDVVLTYGRSFVVEAILKKAHSRDRKFRTVIVDSGPRYEGKELMRRLIAHGLGQCSYALIPSVSFVMKDATKVLVGAHTVSANGSVISRCGTAQIAASAAFHHVPVLVACETYKFTERVQTDSFSYNELGDPSLLVPDLMLEEEKRKRGADSKVASEEAEAAFQRAAGGGAPAPKKGGKAAEENSISETSRLLLNAANCLTEGSRSYRQSDDGILLVNLSYDLTPPEFVAAILTEHGMIPVTAVPVVLREFSAEDDDDQKDRR